MNIIKSLYKHVFATAGKVFLYALTALAILINVAGFAHAERNLDSITFEKKKGISLSKQLESKGINKDDVASALAELNNVYSEASIAPGQQIKLNFEIMDAEGAKIRFSSMEIKISKNQQIQVTRLDNDIFIAHVFEGKAEPRRTFIRATVGSTLFSAAMNAGITQEMFNELVKAYSYDVDFQRDVAPGDTMDVLYEGMYDEDGKLMGNGDILYASLSISRGKFSIYSYTTPDGQNDFYTDDGISVQKSLLRTPVNGARISSGYGDRKHPILGYSKVHKGVDFAAPVGTPVYAAGEGRIIEIKRKGSYGKYIQIFHSDVYSTAYAHLNGFAKNLQRGSHVNQGQIIGYVGSTGRSTGPHLHYEVIEKGRQINPLTVSFGVGKKLSTQEKELFAQYRGTLLSTVERMSAKSHEVTKDRPVTAE